VGYVDLHSHVLFGLDDGAPDASTAVAMLDALATLGVTEQCVTPHQKAAQYLPAWDRVTTTYEEVSRLRSARHPTLRLGAENMWDDVFYGRSVDNTIPHYADTSAFLLELPPPLLPTNLLEKLFDFGRAGKVVVLAHPERYEGLWGDDELARKLRTLCAFQIDLPAIAGFHGKRESKQARHLLELGLAACVATDAHQVGDIQQAQEGLRWIEKKLGHAAVVRLFDQAPRAILSGELPD
jgi:tyrosine-protein phosphatase YwqE